MASTSPARTSDASVTVPSAVQALGRRWPEIGVEPRGRCGSEGRKDVEDAHLFSVRRERADLDGLDALLTYRGTVLTPSIE
jgi:hypothetical protein